MTFNVRQQQQQVAGYDWEREVARREEKRAKERSNEKKKRKKVPRWSNDLHAMIRLEKDSLTAYRQLLSLYIYTYSIYAWEEQLSWETLRVVHIGFVLSHTHLYSRAVVVLDIAYVRDCLRDWIPYSTCIPMNKLSHYARISTDIQSRTPAQSWLDDRNYSPTDHQIESRKKDPLKKKSLGKWSPWKNVPELPFPTV